MDSFKTYLDEQEMLAALSNQHEALSVQQRLKLKRSIIRNKAKIRMGKKRAEMRIANQDVLKNRSMRMARKLMLKRLLKNKDKSELSYTQRQTYEKMLANKKAGIQRLAQKLLPKMRKMEIARKTGGPMPDLNMPGMTQQKKAAPAKKEEPSKSTAGQAE